MHGYRGSDPSSDPLGGTQPWDNLLVNKYAELVYYVATVVVVQPPLGDEQLGGQLIGGEELEEEVEHELVVVRHAVHQRRGQHRVVLHGRVATCVHRRCAHARAPE